MRASDPILLLDARAPATAGVDPCRALLGMSLIRRLAKQGLRTHFARIVVLADSHDHDRLAADLAGLRDTIIHRGPPPTVALGRTVYAPATILGEREWLEHLVHRPVADGVRLTDASGVALLGRGAPFEDAQPQGALSLNPPPLRIRDEEDLRTAHRRLLKSLIKDTDGFVARNIERPVSTAMTARLAATSITPNQITLASGVLGLVAAPFFLSSSPLMQGLGGFIFLVHSIIDGCDGELARLKFQESRWGGVLDFWIDNVVHVAIFGCMALGWYYETRAPLTLILGAVAIVATIFTATFIYWHVMRPVTGDGPLFKSALRDPTERFSKLVNQISGRDFIYLVLILSVFGKASWFLVMTAVGTPIFFFMLVIAAAREGRNARRGI
ncbi:MAG: CDP-alcohol phosphatidyltransferase family protein [Alphaproteobacteria bacterium]